MIPDPAAVMDQPPLTDTPPEWGSREIQEQEWEEIFDERTERNRCHACGRTEILENDAIVRCAGSGCQSQGGRRPTQYHRSCVNPPINEDEMEDWWCERLDCIAPETVRAQQAQAQADADARAAAEAEKVKKIKTKKATEEGKRRGHHSGAPHTLESRYRSDYRCD